MLDLLSASADTPNRLAEYRKYSAIYGRFDAKRKPDKVGTRNSCNQTDLFDYLNYAKQMETFANAQEIQSIASKTESPHVVGQNAFASVTVFSSTFYVTP